MNVNRALGAAIFVTLFILGFSGPSHAVLGAMGPVSPDNGFPEWYTDQDGLALELCLDTGGFCLVTPDILPDPFSPVSFPNNFPDEVFWFDAGADIATAGGVSASLILALEATFTSGAVVDGEQSAFVRQRFRISGLPAASIGQNYTITHPYAQHVFAAVSDGIGGAEIRVTIDAPACFADPTPGFGFTCNRTDAFPNFSSLLGGPIGPFLMWDPVIPPSAPTGFIGNPGVAHQVIGSPTGDNFFRVEGPNVDGLGGTMIETPFFVIQGKIKTFDTNILALVTKYYNDILGRAPEFGAAEAWTAEIERVVALGVDVREGLVAVAKLFFNSAEYLLRARTDPEYVSDLYQTFLNRAPDPGGAAFWENILAEGAGRNVLINYFAFSAEFELFLEGIFGAGPGNRPENDLVNDLYRGFLNRLPDDLGYNLFLGLMRDAQCVDGQAVRNLVDRISLGFIDSAEYALRARTDVEFVEDLYNGILRRGAVASELAFWENLLLTGSSRAEILAAFIASPEFQIRVQAVIDAGCTVI